jgi:3-hydroxyisobutyrate dehydrogenase-like beta-hydroxyacid dehydrogenase
VTESPIRLADAECVGAARPQCSRGAWFDVALMHKDIGLALQTAGELHMSLPSARAADEVLTRAEELGYAHRDIAAFREVYAKMSEW